MAAFTSVRSGTYRAKASVDTWGAGVGVYPVLGDSFTVANGHAITQDAGDTDEAGVDATPTTLCAQTAGTGGTGTLAVSGTFNFYGSVKHGNATWSAAAGGRLNAASTTGRPYWQIADANNIATQPNALLSLVGTGTGSNRARIDKAAGAVGWGIFGTGTGVGAGTFFVDGGRITATWAKIANVGSSATYALQAYLSATGAGWTFTDCWFDGCGPLAHEGSSGFALGAACTVAFTRVSITNPLDTNKRTLFVTSAATATGTRTLTDCNFEGQVRMLGSGGNTINHGWYVLRCAFYTSVTGITALDAAAQGGVWNQLEGCLILNEIASSNDRAFFPNPATVKDCYFVRASTSGSGLDNVEHTPSTNVVWDGCTFEIHNSGAPTTVGDDSIITNNNGIAVAITAQNCITLPNDGGVGSGSVLTAGGGGAWTAGRTLLSQKNTHYGQTAGSCCALEHGTPPAACATSRSNLVWRSAASAGQPGLYFSVSGAVKLTIVNGALTGNYNWSYNMTGTGYAGETGTEITVPDKYTAAPGANDQTGNPQFVDSTRNFKSWGQSITPGLTTRKQVWDEIAKASTDNAYTAGFTVAALLAWVRAGFAPQNPLVMTAGHDGLRAGAVDAPAGGHLAAHWQRPRDRRHTVRH